MVGTWPSVAPKARAPCLLLWLLCLTAQRALGLRRTVQAPEGDRVEEQEPGAEDPLDLSHDGAAPTVGKFLDLSSPICFRDVPSPRNNCKLMSQALCDRKSIGLESLEGGHRQCLAHRRSCAVVGSSEHLLNASWGSFIDSQDLVIRINGAPAGSVKAAAPEGKSRQVDRYAMFGSHVGTRTDVRFINHLAHLPRGKDSGPPMCLFLNRPALPEACGGSCSRHPGLCNVSCSRPGALESFCVRGTCDLDQLRCRAASMTTEKDWGDNYVFMDNVHAALADQVMAHSTTGFVAVMYAMTVCEKIFVLGFGPSCSGVVGARYYNSHAGPKHWHHYDDELTLLEKATRHGAEAMIPPDAQSMIRAKSVQVMLPSCVDTASLRSLSGLFQSLGSGVTADVISGAEGEQHF